MNNAGSGLQIAFFVVITLVIAICFDQFGSTTRESITSMLSTQAELEHTRDSLEVAVGERTAELQEALDATRAQAAEQARLLEENKAQRLIIRDLSVPALPVSEHILVMPLVGTLDEQRLQMVQEQSLRSITQSRAKYLLLDITGVPIVDTQIAQGLMATVASAKLLGAEAVLVGIRPEVAQTIVSIGIRLEGVRTFSTLYSAISHVEQIRAHGHTKK
ncbi:MAG: STAS domain-containing protein [Oscillochloris sp.]|nr:STAS domain-containing protein [Oscillochloris sp.]